MKFRDHPVDSRVKMIVAGDSGSGKTGLLSTLANSGYNVAIMDFDNGLDVLASYLKPEAVDNVHYMMLEDDAPGTSPRKSAWGKFCDVMDKGWKDDTEDLGSIKDWGSDWVLVIDTLNSMGNAAMRATLSQAKIAVDAQPRIQDYGEAGRKVFNRVVPLLSNDYKCHIICNTHLRAETDDYDRTKYYPATIGSALSKELPKWFNNVVRIDSKPNGERVIRTKSDNRMALKTSCPTIFQDNEEFDLAKLIATIQENARELLESNTPK